MFGFVRLMLGALIFAVLVILIRKSNVVRKRWVYLITAGVVILAVSLSNLIPFENAFVTFQTPETAFQYVNMKTDIELTVYGEKSCLVIGKKDGINPYLIVPKVADGWKTDSGYHTKIISKMFESITVSVYQHKTTGDCYITVFDTEGNPVDLHDNYHTAFIQSERKVDLLNKTYTTYYAYLPHFDGDYQLVLNGSTVTVTDKNMKGDRLNEL